VRVGSEGRASLQGRARGCGSLQRVGDRGPVARRLETLRRYNVPIPDGQLFSPHRQAQEDASPASLLGSLAMEQEEDGKSGKFSSPQAVSKQMSHTLFLGGGAAQKLPATSPPEAFGTASHRIPPGNGKAPVHDAVPRITRAAQERGVTEGPLPSKGQPPGVDETPSPRSFSPGLALSRSLCLLGKA
jgi:hypothetical protein